MTKNIFAYTFCLLLHISYSQKINLNTHGIDSVGSELYIKMLNGINGWEKKDKTGHIVKSFESVSAANDSTISFVAIPNIKISIVKDSLNKKEFTYDLSFGIATEFYIKPYPFTNKIYSYNTDDFSNQSTSNVALNGARGSNFITNALEIDKTFKPLFCGYFLDKDRYWNNFLIEKNKNEELLIIDRQLKTFHNMGDFIKYRYGSIENLIWLIKKKDKDKNNIVLFIVNNLIATEQTPIVNPNDIEKYDILDFNDSKLTIYKDLWKYDLVIDLKLNSKVQLLDLKQFYDRFHIKEKDKKLKICLDKKLIEDSKNLWINPLYVSKIEIMCNTYFVGKDEIKTAERFINIESKTNSKLK